MIGNAGLKQQAGEPLSDEKPELVSGGLFAELTLVMPGFAMAAAGVTTGTRAAGYRPPLRQYPNMEIFRDQRDRNCNPKF